MEERMESTLRLFKALPIKTKKRETNDELMGKTIRRGFVFAPEVIANYSNYDELIRLVEKTIGLTSEQMNSSFHKSWTKVKEADIEQLVVEQIAHYLTTYGKEDPELYLIEKGIQWGVDDLSTKVADLDDIEMDKVQNANYVYIPNEVLNLPDIGAIQLVVIKGHTKEELTEKLLALLESGIALGEDTIQAAVEVAMFVGLNDFERVKNKEVKAVLYDHSGLFPENPIEFLRFVIFKATSTTLLIKSPELLQSVKGSNNLNITKVFGDYEKKYGLERLAEIFYRFKPIFLAFRTNERMKVVVNKVRRLAVKNHKPLPEDFLNTITARIGNGEEIITSKLQSELSRVNIFRKIRLAYALKFRTKNVESILYRIRNGKGYATAFSFGSKNEAEVVLNIVLDSIAQDVSKNVGGKKIYIPKYVNYSLPATEKQFTGNFPSGTYVSIPNDMVAGIHWNNVKQHRVDLDLSLIAETGKIGWDGYYRTDDRDVLFSGDVTDARNGASELFYVKKQARKAFIVFVNYYNFDAEVEVPYKILVAKEAVKDFKNNYMVNPNNIVAITNSVINQKQKIIGLLVTAMTGNRFYFAETSIGKSITSGSSKFVTHSRKYLLDFYENTIALRDILVKAGAEVVSEKEEADIDLSPETLEKDSILTILK
jgi:hypothetical protein